MQNLDRFFSIRVNTPKTVITGQPRWTMFTRTAKICMIFAVQPTEIEKKLLAQLVGL
jgi:hypothetical protein